jgi:hypothetical protein
LRDGSYHVESAPGNIKAMAEVVYVARVRVERVRGPLRLTWVAAEEEPIRFGVHDEIADHYGVERGGEIEHATTLDYLAAAAAT